MRLRILLFSGLLTLALIFSGCTDKDKSPNQERVASHTLTKSSTANVGEKPKARQSTTDGLPARALSTPREETKQAPEFSADRAIEHTRQITSLGPRVEGSKQEAEACDYASKIFKGLGYTVNVQEFRLPTGRISHNLIVDIPGVSDPEKVLVITAHIDSISVTPGANDDALGVGMLLELARVFKDQKPPYTLRLIVFGAEEYGNKALDQHHLGSRYYVSQLTPEEKKKIAGMVSIDVIGYGDTFRACSLGRGSKAMCDFLIGKAGEMDMKMVYWKSPEWSDHEPFEKAGIDSAWLFTVKDPTYHSPKDVVSHIVPKNVDLVGKLLVKTVKDIREK